MKWKTTAVMLALCIGLGLYVGLVEARKPADDTTKQEDRVLRFDPKEIKGLAVMDGAKSITFSQEKGAWKMDRPGKMDRQAFDSALESLKRLDSRRVVANQPTADDLKAGGLEKPTRSLSFTWSKSDEKLPQKVLVGGENLDKTGYFVQVQPAGNVHIVDKWSLDTVLKWAASPPVKAAEKKDDGHQHED